MHNWSSYLRNGATLKIEDLYEYDFSQGAIELGRGRYATIRPGRRRRELRKPTGSTISSMENLSIEERDKGILKKKPSFSSFPSLNVLAQEEYECALKIVDKKLFWKHVNRGTERADSIVRETCVQAELGRTNC